jgi:hypothetical protein
MAKMINEDREQLHKLFEDYGAALICNMMASWCADKANYIAFNDEEAAELWDEGADTLKACAESL